MKAILNFAFAIALFANPALAAAAPGQVAMQGDVRLEKSITENGKTRVELQEPKVVVPGDRLLFTTRYTNSGTTPVQNFVVTNPLPTAVMLSAEAGATYNVSVDGGKTWGSLGQLSVSDGKGGTRPAAAADVTHLRWVIPTIAAGASGEVKYHAIVR